MTHLSNVFRWRRRVVVFGSLLSMILPAAYAAGENQASAVPAAANADVCRLLSDEDVRTVQETAVRERKPTEQRSGAMRVSHCAYLAANMVNSVSVSLMRPAAPQDAAAVRTYWARTIEARRGRPAPPPGAAPSAAPPKSQPPRPVEGLGERALWSGDGRTGSLYVLAGGSILRVSAGGAGTEGDRRDRSVKLARLALERLTAVGATSK